MYFDLITEQINDDDDDENYDSTAIRLQTIFICYRLDCVNKSGCRHSVLPYWRQ